MIIDTNKTHKHITIVILFLLIGMVTGCNNAPAPYLRIGTNVWPGYEPLYLARELGFFSGSRIHLVEHGSASSVISAFNNHTIDAAGVTLDEALQLLEYGHDIRIVLVMDISHGADAIIAKPYIKTIAGLKNQRVAVENTALGALVLSRALEIADMKLVDIKVIKANIDEQEKMYKTNMADAVVTFDPVLTRLLNVGANKIFDSSQIPGEIVDVLVVRRDYIENNPAVINKLIATWFKTLQYLKINPDKSFAQLSSRLQLTPNETRQAFNGITLPDHALNQKLIISDLGLRASSLKLQEIMLKNKLIKSAVDTDLLFMDELGINRHFSLGDTDDGK